MKVNIFISHAPEDKPVAARLMEWLYPMRDEVNVWHYDPPGPPPALPLSWKFLLPWYKPTDPRTLYAEALRHRRENAHIYVFLISYKSLRSEQVELDVDLAVRRRVECVWGDLAPLVLPVLIGPSQWKEASRLAQFEPLAGGVALSDFSNPDDGYQLVAQQIAAQTKALQVKLHEAMFRHYYPDTHQAALVPETRWGFPYLGENPQRFEFNPPPPFRPADWTGWSLIALMISVSVGSYKRIHPAVSSLHLKARLVKEYYTEYPRQPYTPLPDTQAIVLPPVE